MHRAASWMGARGTEAEALRVRACSRASKEAAAGRTLALLAVDIFAQLLPSLPRVLEEEIRARAKAVSTVSEKRKSERTW